MRTLSIAFLFLLLAIGFTACQKNSGSKIPQISLIAFLPTDSLIIKHLDTAVIYFSLADGDGDLGNDTTSVIHLKDSRFPELGFIKTPFPAIDGSIEDPKKGLTGECIFFPDPPFPRDSTRAVLGDTLYYEFYITDRAGNESNHIITHKIFVKA